MTEKKFETAPELARRWGVTRGRVHQLIVDGRLPAVKMGRDWLIPDTPLLSDVKRNERQEIAV
jgi:excisionase family DNA binding protein